MVERDEELRERIIRETAEELGEDPQHVRDFLDAVDCCAEEETFED